MLQKVLLGAVGVLVLAVLLAGTKLVEFVGAEQIVVIQYVNGSLEFATVQGPWMQWLGSTEAFRKRSQFWFSSLSDQGKKEDQSLRIRFNDNAHAKISGSVSWDMPLDKKCLALIYQKYRTQAAVEHELIRTVLEKSVYMTGPLMSATESASERRNQLLQLIEDQIENGVYLTHTVQREQIDPLTKEKRSVNVAEIVTDKQGKPTRAGDSPLRGFCIKTYNLSINEIKYDADVEKQIQQQQAAIMGVRIAMAKSIEAEQNTRTISEQGKASAAQAKWEQEKINSTIVAEAEGKRRAEEQNAIAAKYYRDAQLLKAEGDAGYRAKIMAADNALEKRLDAYVKSQQIWAKAVGEYKGQWVPSIVSGGSQGQGNGATTLIDLLSAKTAKELGLDLGLQARK